VNDKADLQAAESDVFQRRLRGEALAAATAPDTSAPSVYVPYGLAIEGRDEEGLTFYHADGMITVKFYAHLTEIICTAPQFLTLIYMDCVYTLHGRNLFELIPLIKRHKLDGMQCYDRVEYPAEPIKGVVIYTITRESHEEIAEHLRESGRGEVRD
jgi:hypothetical protein